MMIINSAYYSHVALCICSMELTQRGDPGFNHMHQLNTDPDTWETVTSMIRDLRHND